MHENTFAVTGNLEMLVYLKSVGCPWSEQTSFRGAWIKDIRMFFGGCIGTTVQLITWNVDELRSSLGI